MLRSTLKHVATLLLALLLVFTAFPWGVLAEETVPRYGLGLVPFEGDAPLLDTARFKSDLRSLPSAVDLRPNLPPIGNQGAQNSCVGWAIGYYYKTYQERLERGWNVNSSANQFSPAFIYNQRPTSSCAQDYGMSMYAGLNIVKTKGAATLASFPYSQSNTCTQPTQAQLTAAWPYRSTSFAAIFVRQGEVDINVLKSMLANGQAFLLAVPIYSSFYRVTYNNPVVPMPAAGESFYGGHAMFVAGYDDAMGGFLTANSWGTSWGRSGYGYLSYDFVAQEVWEGWTMTDWIDTSLPAVSEGSVSMEGAPAPAGTTVSAWIDDARVALTSTYAQSGEARYQIEIPSDNPNTPEKDGGAPGDVLRFKINSLWDQVTVPWTAGQAATRHFTISSASSQAPSMWVASYGRDAGGWHDDNIFPRMLGDVNGDGKADIVAFGNRAVYVSLSDGSGFAAPKAWLAAYGPAAGGWTNYNTFPRMLGDVNGDGRADIVAFGNRATYVSLSTGKGFTAPAVWISTYGPAAGGWTDQNTFPRMLGDVNGDGRADIVAFGARATYVSLSTGSRFSAPVAWINGYGTLAGGWSSYNTFPRMLGDVNGDGKADIVAFGNNATFVSLSTGSSFAAAQTWVNAFGVSAGGWTSQDAFPRMVADVNGDGKADVIGCHADGVQVSLSSGRRLGAPASWITSFGTSAGDWMSQSVMPRRAADVDGDGRADIVGFGLNGTVVDVTSLVVTSVYAGARSLGADADVVASEPVPPYENKEIFSDEQLPETQAQEGESEETAPSIEQAPEEAAAEPTVTPDLETEDEQGEPGQRPVRETGRARP